MFEKILIPLDGTLRAEQALELTSKLFDENVELILLETTGDNRVTFPTYAAGSAGYIEPLPEFRKARNDEYVAAVTSATKTWAPKVKGFSLIGAPAEKIVEIAEVENVDLIMMVTHGYSAFEKLLLGSVTEQVIRMAPCPVFAIRDGHIPEHMLIALDGTDFSEEILDPAIGLAKLLGADITLARVDTPQEDLDYRELEEIRAIDRELANRVLYTHNSRTEFYLDDIRKRYLEEVNPVNINIDYDVDYGNPSKRLPEAASRHNCDLIAMATHGRTG
ncbi:MAG: universal stress protein, partial [Chloroflexota bacterium]